MSGKKGIKASQEPSETHTEVSATHPQSHKDLYLMARTKQTCTRTNKHKKHGKKHVKPVQRKQVSVGAKFENARFLAENVVVIGLKDDVVKGFMVLFLPMYNSPHPFGNLEFLGFEDNFDLENIGLICEAGNSQAGGPVLSDYSKNSCLLVGFPQPANSIYYVMEMKEARAGPFIPILASYLTLKQVEEAQDFKLRRVVDEDFNRLSAGFVLYYLQEEEEGMYAKGYYLCRIVCR